MTNLPEYELQPSNISCPYCKHPAYITTYTHRDGWRIRGFPERQWVYYQCTNPKCKHQASWDYPQFKDRVRE